MYRVAPSLTEIRPKPNLAETCFLVTEQYASDKTNDVNNAEAEIRCNPNNVSEIWTTVLTVLSQSYSLFSD